MNTHLKCMFFNANGILHRYDDILKFTNENLIDLVFVVESHLKDNNSSLPFLHSSLPAFSGDSGGLIGGITVLCRNSDVRKNLKLKSTSKANLWLILQLDNQLIAVCYFPPSRSFKPHMQCLMKELEALSDNWTLNVTIVGDFNARAKWTGDHLNTPRGAELKDIIQDIFFRKKKMTCLPMSFLMALSCGWKRKSCSRDMRRIGVRGMKSSRDCNSTNSVRQATVGNFSDL